MWVKECQANTKKFQLYFFMEQEREVQPQVCNTGTRESEFWAGQQFSLGTQKLCPNLVQPLEGHWLMEDSHHGAVPKHYTERNTYLLPPTETLVDSKLMLLLQLKIYL